MSMSLTGAECEPSTRRTCVPTCVDEVSCRATAATNVGAVRINGQAGGRGRRSGVFGHGALHGEWPTDAEMAKPVAGSDDRSSVLEPFCLTTVDSRSR